ncbi:hypothetical protein DFH28DRAFT_885854 [Melampsora americana]|nr:hypothetical protein DFH28DRAFT_885854 [Melampsora americana]
MVTTVTPSSFPTDYEPNSSPNTYQTRGTSVEDATLSTPLKGPIPINRYGYLSPGPHHVTRTSPKPRRDSVFVHLGIPMQSGALPEVLNWIDQCFHCGQFGHRQSSCPDAKAHRRPTAEHFNNWRLVRFGKYGPTKLYSVFALWPSLMAIEAAPKDENTSSNRPSYLYLSTVPTAVKETYRPITPVHGPPPIPWATRPSQRNPPPSDEVFFDAGCICLYL